MGKTLVIFKLTASDMEQLEKIVKAIPKIQIGEVRDVKRQPIGFGIEVIRTAVLIPEKQDAVLDAVTKELQQIAGVEEVEVESMTLL
jgi:translation elongation factor EF-1beta